MAKAGSQLETASLYMYESCQRRQAYADKDMALDTSERQVNNSVTNHKRFTASLVCKVLRDRLKLELRTTFTYNNCEANNTK